MTAAPKEAAGEPEVAAYSMIAVAGVVAVDTCFGVEEANCAMPWKNVTSIVEDAVTALIVRMQPAVLVAGGLPRR